MSTKERFAVIDEAMTEQKRFIETQFALHRQQNNEIMSTISRVLRTLTAGSSSVEIREVIAEEKKLLTQGLETSEVPRSTLKDYHETEDVVPSHTSSSTSGSGHQLHSNDNISSAEEGGPRNHVHTSEPVRKDDRPDATQTLENGRGTGSDATALAKTKPKSTSQSETARSPAKLRCGGKVADRTALPNVQTAYSKKNTRLFTSSTSGNVMTLDRLKAGQDRPKHKPFGKGEGQKVKTLANLKEEEWKEECEGEEAFLAHLRGLTGHIDGTVDREDVLKSLTR